MTRRISTTLLFFVGIALFFAGCGDSDDDKDGGTDGGGSMDTDTDTDSDTDTDTDTDADADADADTDADTDTDADADADTDADTDTDADADAGTDTGDDTDLDGGDDTEADGGDDTEVDAGPPLDCFYNGEIFSGTASDRDLGGADGNCSFANATMPSYYVTVSRDLYNASAVCGRCVRLKNTSGGQTVEAMIVDQCPDGSQETCGVANDLALSPAAADALEVGDAGVPVDWHYVPCEGDGYDTIKFRYKSDTSVDWFALQILDHRNALERVEIRVNDEWRDAVRQDWNYWVIESCCGAGPFDIRVTDIYGNVLTGAGIPFSPGETLDGPGQFPECAAPPDTDDGDTESDTQTEPDPALLEGQDSALRCNTPPTIDGTPNEALWSLGTSANLTASGTPNNTASFDAVWDETYLYVAVSVTDDIDCVGIEADSWWYDSVEIYLDPDNSKTAYDSMDVHMVIKHSDDLSWRKFGANTQNTSLAYEATGAVTDGGYTIEARIPWAGLGVTTPAADLVIGFDIGVNDNDMTDCTGVNDTSRSSELRWQGDGSNYQTTVNFGELVLFPRSVN